MLRVLALLVALALAAGCGPGGSASPAGRLASPGADGIALAAVQAPRLSTTADDRARAGAAVNAFGLELYQHLVAKDPAGSLVFSPASIELALAMARAGARGTTADEMDAVMHALGSDANAAWIAALDASLNTKTATFTDDMGDDQEVILRSVNAPFAQHGFPLEAAYLEALASRFGAGLRLVDYVGDTEGSRGTINRWVAAQTEERIPELLAAGVVKPSTRLVLVNAIYLKAAWQFPFLEDATEPAPFTRLDGSEMEVAMMRTAAAFPFAAGDGWRAVELAYVGRRLSMLIIVPDDLAAFEAGLNAAAFDAIAGALESREVRLGLPAFGTETAVRLEDVLGALGMPTAFDAGAADFSGMTTADRLFISAVVHQANIDVDEAGTEAAAATGVAMAASGAPAEPVSLTVDRPFIFALRDHDSGAVLFLGRVTEPAPRS